MTKRIKRIFGYVVYHGLAKRLPASHGIGGGLGKTLRVWSARMMLEYCGADVNIEKGAVFSTRCELGNRSGIGINAQLNGRVIIGEEVLMGPNCTVYTTNHRYQNINVPIGKQGMTEERPVVIESGVWIGSHVIILPGRIIHEGAIVGAGAVVAKDVPPYAIAAGNPAVIVGSRIDDEPVAAEV